MDQISSWARKHPASTGDIVQLARDCAKQLGANAIVLNHMKRCDAGGRNLRPEHAIGEKMYAMLLAAAAPCPESADSIQIWGGNVEKLPAETAFGLVPVIAMAQLYLWSNKIEQLADSSPLPEHIVSRSVMPFPIMFWSRESCYTFVMDGQPAMTNWILLFHAGDRIRIVQDLMFGTLEKPAAHRVRLIISDIKYGDQWPDAYPTDQQDHVARFLKRCAFLNSPYVDTKKAGLPRHIRRQIEALGQTPVKEETHVVVLRKQKAKPLKPSGDSMPVQWHHQWWVSAHYRAQWYPSEQAHKVIWIAPHLKGPSDKPILEKVYAVLR